MDVRRRSISGEPLKTQKLKMKHQREESQQVIPLVPLSLTNSLFFVLFFSVAYFLLSRWREKIRTSTPLHVITSSETAAIVSLLASFIYLLGFFGVGFVHPVSSSRASSDDELSDDEIISKEDSRLGMCGVGLNKKVTASAPVEPIPAYTVSQDDEEIVQAVVSGSIPSYSLESRLSDCRRAAVIRHEAVERVTGRSLEGLPVEGFDYNSILGQCCEMPVGFVQIPVGVAGPLLLDGKEYTVPMATTEGCLVASTNRGCKAIYASGGASSVLLRDAMTRAPVVRFASATRAAKLKFYLEDPHNFEELATIFNSHMRGAGTH